MKQLSDIKCKNANGTAYNRTKYLKQRVGMMQQWSDYLDNLMAFWYFIFIIVFYCYGGGIDYYISPNLYILYTDYVFFNQYAIPYSHYGYCVFWQFTPIVFNQNSSQKYLISRINAIAFILRSKVWLRADDSGFIFYMISVL